MKEVEEVTHPVTESESIKGLIRIAISSGYAISLWRLPDTDEKNLIVCTTGCGPVDEISIEESEPGFIISPFDTQKKKQFLKADQVYVFKQGKVNFHSHPVPPNVNFKVGNKQSSPTPIHSLASNFRPEGDKEHYLAAVANGIQAISEGTFEKVVPSRCKEFELSEGFDVVDTFEKLCRSYPHAFVSFISTPGLGSWMGASPELLVSVDKNLQFRTTAVAGTQKIPLEGDLRNVPWTQKEIEEQALVSRYIINCFKKIRLREFEEHGPKTWTAGNLIHLRTDYKVDMVATNFPQLGTVMAKLLHPTSAVCGMPLEPALSFLQNHEQYDRQLYAGYLGPVNFNQESHLFVNLRCMRIQGGKALLFAGAGVTEDSIPEKEWEETEMKMNTLLEVIQP
jgi:isochorismate synthase